MKDTLKATVIGCVLSGGLVFGATTTLHHFQMEEKKHEINLLDKKVDSLEKEAEKNEEQIDSLTLTNDLLIKQKNELTEQVSGLEKQASDLQKAKQNLESEVASLKKKINAKINKETATMSSQSVATYKMKITAYQAFCREGCTGRTRTGLDVSSTVYYQGMRVVAVDPSVIPLHSTLRITLDEGGSFMAKAMDTGGGINGYELDYLVASESEAKQFGVRTATVELIKRGK